VGHDHLPYLLTPPEGNPKGELAAVEEKEYRLIDDSIDHDNDDDGVGYDACTWCVAVVVNGGVVSSDSG